MNLDLYVKLWEIATLFRLPLLTPLSSKGSPPPLMRVKQFTKDITVTAGGVGGGKGGR